MFTAHYATSTQDDDKLSIVLRKNIIEPHLDKTNKMACVPSEETQISLGIRPVWFVFAVHLMGS